MINTQTDQTFDVDAIAADLDDDRDRHVICHWCHKPIAMIAAWDYTRTGDDHPFCDLWCYTEWAADSFAESTAAMADNDE